MSNKANGKIYHSFDEIGQELFNLKPQRRVTRDKQKLVSQREKLLGTCPHCGQQLRFVYGTNVLACVNEDCKGKKYTNTNANGEEIVRYKPYTKIMDDRQAMIANIIFDEKENGK